MSNNLRKSVADKATNIESNNNHLVDDKKE